MDNIYSDRLKRADVKTVKQSDLTAECWMVQIFGINKCKKCEYFGTKKCGGKNILTTGKNEKDIEIPL